MDASLAGASREPIAITGLDCRFPGADDPDEFFSLLLRGGIAISTVPADRWDAASYYAPDAGAGRTNTRNGGFLTDVDAFDAAFFRISPAEAAAMDPQQRLLLQCAWRALEDSGIDPQTAHQVRTGVFVGVMANEWAQLYTKDVGAITPLSGSGNGYGMVANRISYQLNLRGPSLAVDTACSSSLLAVHLAAQSLASGECDRALVGTTNLILTPVPGIFYAQAGLSAPDGRCKPFSATADGIGRGEGVAVVVLRRLSDAQRAGEPVYAVIRGSATGHDGRSNGITAPNRWAQVDVVERALAQAGVLPRQVTFVEAHGTGTVLGDMIEVKALGQLHGTSRERPCLLGSVKGNIGHTEAAAGLAGLVKVALALHHRVVPPTLCAQENPGLRLARNGLELVTDPTPLPAPAVAGVSSFGIGGTNVHIVLASAPGVTEGAEGSPTDCAADAGVLTLSASSEAALRRNCGRFARWLDELPAGDGTTVSSVAAATNRVKAGLAWRVAVPLDGRDRLVQALEAVAENLPTAGAVGCATTKPRVGFVFSGHGGQHPGMSAALLSTSTTYRRHFETADAALAGHVGRDLIPLVEHANVELMRPRYCQPALFAVGYALGRTLIDAGVTPAVVLGHSVGEYAAACLSGILPLDEAARLIAARGALMDDLPPGGAMLACGATAHDIRHLLGPDDRVCIAAYNGPADTVVSGDTGGVDAFAAVLDRAGVHTQRLEVTHAFHSALMEPMLQRFAAVAGSRAAGTGRAGGSAGAPLVSTLSGGVVDPGEIDAGYWTHQIREPVRFADAVSAAVAQGVTHLVEIGPRPVLTGLLSRQVDGVRCRPALGRDGDLRPALAALYQDGADVRWDVLYPARGPMPRLPRYTFDRTVRYRPSEVPTPVPERVTADRPQTTQIRPGEATDLELDVRAAIARICGHDLARIGPCARLHEDLGVDSMQLIGLKRELDERFPATVDVPVRDFLPHVSTVGALAGFIATIVRRQDAGTATKPAVPG